MILGCLLLALPLWPLTMSFRLWYALGRHWEPHESRTVPVGRRRYR